jgi:hypothetical protein
MRKLQGFKKFEAVGVPSGLVDIAKNLYDEIQSSLEEGTYLYEEEEADPDQYKYPVNHIYFTMPIRYSGKINDYQIRKFDVRLDLTVVDFPNKSMGDDRISGAAYGPTQRIDRKNFRVIYEDNGSINLMIKMQFSKPDDEMGVDEWQDKVSEILSKERTSVIKSLGHELMHAYDLGHIKGGEGHKTSSKYAAYNDIRFGIKEVDEFFYYLYYTTRCESIVRSAEVASGMDAQGIEQDKFHDYLTNNDTYKMLKEISKWTFDGFVNELSKDLALDGTIDETTGKERHSVIKNNLRESGMDDIENYTDEEIIEYLLTIIVDNINRRSIHSLISKIRVPNIFGLSLIDPEDDATDEEKSEFVNSFTDEAMKNVENPEAYFRSKEKFFHETAGKLLKKLSKLYSIATPSNVNPMHAKINAKNKKNESNIISNFDLFSKLKKHK